MLDTGSENINEKIFLTPERHKINETHYPGKIKRNAFMLRVNVTFCK